MSRAYFVSAKLTAAKVPLTWAALLPQANLDFDNDDDERVLLLVHDTRPPFLDGHINFSKQVRIASRLSGAELACSQLA